MRMGTSGGGEANTTLEKGEIPVAGRVGQDRTGEHGILWEKHRLKERD